MKSWVRWQVALAALAVVCVAHADNADQKPDAARIGWLDKQTNRYETVVMKLGQPQTLGDLEVEVDKCLPDYKGVLGQDVGWIKVTDAPSVANARTAPWFEGWMFNTFPEVATLDHPRYDMQLMGCGAKPRKIINTAPVIIDTQSEGYNGTDESGDGGADTEAPASPAGNDPYYVPGVEKPAEEALAPAQQEQPEQQPVQPQPESRAPVGAPVEAQPAQPAQPVQSAPSGPNGGDVQDQQEDLHRMMDGGVY